MGGQFKKPFEDPKERSESDAYTSFIAEKNTLKPPAVKPSVTQFFPPNTVPPQGYVQGQHGQYGPRPTRPLFSGADTFSPVGNSAINPSFALPQTPRLPGPSSMQPGGSSTAFGSVATPGMSMLTAPPLASGVRPAVEPGSTGDGPARKRVNSSALPGKKRKKRRRVPIWARIVIGFLTVLLLLGGGSFWYYQANFAGVVNTITSKQFTRAHGEEDPNAGKTGSVLNWGRVNILLLGSDTDEKPIWGGNSFLAQTVIVASIDTSTHDVEMLSIPRDYWLNIPGYGMDKLDTAFAHGGSINHNMSGVSEVVLTLDQDFGIPINFYAWVGLNGFISIINTVGGVDVNVSHPVVDDTYPDDIGTTGSAQNNFKRLYIPDGPQHLDGPTALEYVRSRHSTTDFDRSARQQQVLSALKLKLDNTGIIGELPQIANDLKGSVYTSLNPTQVIDLVNFARGIDPNKIQHLTLGGSVYTSSGTVDTPYGSEDAVFPKCAEVVPAIDTFLHITTATCNITENGSNPSQVALSNQNSQPTDPGVTTGSTSGSSMDGPLASVNPLNNLFGLRGLIDLMSMVVLDSPQA